jgi:hypothetical protein
MPELLGVGKGEVNSRESCWEQADFRGESARS